MNGKDKDYYGILGVKSDASQDDIKKAFRALAKQCHPDAVPEAEKKSAEERFKLVSEAYDVLGDEGKRRNYDLGKGSPFRVSMDDIFGFASTRGGGTRQGADISGAVEVSLEDAVYGARRAVALRRMAGCSTCGASGAADGKRVTCSTCGGVGVVFREFGNGFMRVSAQSMCPSCGGDGAKATSPCLACSGKRYAFVDEEVMVDIPAGVLDGATLRVAGHGSWGPGGDGDLIMSVRVMLHDRFKSVPGQGGRDLLTTLELPFRTVLAGGEAILKGLRDEEIKVAVPRPCQHGHEVVMPGLGPRGGSLRVRLVFRTPSISDEDIAKLPI